MNSKCITIAFSCEILGSYVLLGSFSAAIYYTLAHFNWLQ